MPSFFIRCSCLHNQLIFTWVVQSHCFMTQSCLILLILWFKLGTHHMLDPHIFNTTTTTATTAHHNCLAERDIIWIFRILWLASCFRLKIVKNAENWKSETKLLILTSSSIISYIFSRNVYHLKSKNNFRKFKFKFRKHPLNEVTNILTRSGY